MQVISVPITKKMLKRLDDFSVPEPNSGCFLWIGAIVPRGYGKLGTTVNGKNVCVYAHRVAYAARHGEWPQVVRHKCDNPYCVNPDHLEGGNHVDNMGDKVSRGRQLRGRDIHNSVLTENDVRSLVEFIIHTKISMSELARRFGVDIPAVTTLRDGTRWRGIISDDDILAMNISRPKKIFTYLDEDQSKEVRLRFSNEESVSHICKSMGVKRKAVTRIRNEEASKCLA